MAQYIITNQQEDIPFENCDTEVKRVIQNAKNLLMTQMGEVPYDRLRGFDNGLMSLPIDQFRAELPREIDRILLWEPRAKAVSATAEMIRDEKNRIRNGDVLIQVVIDVQIQE